jgi:RNA polymerase sigma factor (sigma-70 family)
MPPSLDDLFGAFRDGRGDVAWTDFLECCGGLLLQAARSACRDEDDAADAFVFVCERLAERGYLRLRKFDPAGPAQPATWLRAVARNLALDYRRRIHGRFRVFESVSRLPAFDQLVFRRRYRDRFTLEETLASLRSHIPALTLEAVAAADQRLGAVLTPRQRFAMAVERPRIEPLRTSDESGDRRPIDPPAPGPSPEDVLAGIELRTRLRAALATLSPNDRLLVRLRLEQELTLSEIAVIAGFTGPQQADRHLREIYARLRAVLP